MGKKFFFTKFQNFFSIFQIFSETFGTSYTESKELKNFDTEELVVNLKN
jgi:hypothetical protein